MLSKKPYQLHEFKCGLGWDNYRAWRLCYGESMYTCIIGYAVSQLIDVLRHKSEDRGFDSQW